MITAVPNSPVGWSDQEQMKTQPRESDYCQPWKEDETMRFQLQFSKVGYDILEGAALTPYLTGVSTTVGSSQLIDSGASFATPPIQISHIIVNTDTSEQSTVDGVFSTTAVDTADDIFGTGTSGDGYAFVALRLPVGNVLYNGVLDTISFSPNISENSFIIEDAFPNTSSNGFVVEVDIEDYAGGALSVQQGSYPVTFSTLDDTQPFATANGTWSFYGIPTGNDLKIIDISEESNYTITGIRVYYGARPEVFVFDGQDEIDDIDPAAAYYFNNRAIFEIPFDYGEGCFDLYANNFNGLVGRSNFPLSYPWQITNIGTGWAIVANELIHTSGGAVGTNTAVYPFTETTDPDCNYVVYFRFDTGADKPGLSLVTAAGDIALDTYFGSEAGPSVYVNFTGYEATGVKFTSTEIDSVGLDAFNVYNTFYNNKGGYFSPSGNSLLAAYATPFARIAPVFCTPTAKVCVKELSNLYIEYESTITNTSTDPVKKKDRWIPDLSTYSEKCYVQSNVRFARYQDEDFESYRDSVGRVRLVYSDRVKVKECQISPVPVWFHDWMTWAIRNTFTVNGVEYYPIEGSYSPDWSRRSPNAPAVFDIAEQDQNIKTTGCD
jgi:hypothetical protein